MTSWDTEGGFAREYSGTVEEAWFGTDARNTFNPDALFIMWRIKLDDPLEFPGLHDGYTTERFSCGSDWATEDGGETAVHPQEGKKFHQSSNYGKIINRAVKEWGLLPELQKRGDPTVASVWNGLRFQFGPEPWKYEDRSGERTMPIAYLGASDSGSNNAKSNFDLSSLQVPADHLAALKDAAATAGTHGAFVNNVLGLPEEVRTSTVMTALADEGLYHALKG